MAGNHKKKQNKNTRSNRILYILTRFPVPTETFILNELREVLRQGLDYDLFSFHVDRAAALEPPYSEVPAKQLPRAHHLQCLSALVYFIRRDPSTVLRILGKKYCKKTHHALQAFYLARWCMQHHTSHIHAHYAYHSTSAARIVSALTGITYSFTAHANDIFKSSWQMREKIEDSLFCATCTGYNREYLGKTCGAALLPKIHKVYHGIDMDLFRPNARNVRMEDSICRIVSVARLREKKGLNYLLMACAELQKTGLELNATIVGDGPDRERLESLAHRLGIREHVRFTGSIQHEEVKKILAASEIFVLPCVVASDGSRDGIPNVILEAMAMELPVVSTHVSAIPEAVVHEQTGIIADPEDPAGLAQAIVHLHSNPDMRQRLGIHGRKRVKELFDLDTNTRTLVQLFQKAIEDNPHTTKPL